MPENKKSNTSTIKTPFLSASSAIGWSHQFMSALSAVGGFIDKNKYTIIGLSLITMISVAAAATSDFLVLNPDGGGDNDHFTWCFRNDNELFAFKVPRFIHEGVDVSLDWFGKLSGCGTISGPPRDLINCLTKATNLMFARFDSPNVHEPLATQITMEECLVGFQNAATLNL